MAKISTRDGNAIATALANREAFQTHGSLSGAPGKVDYLGRLPKEYSDRYNSATVAYTVLSYLTPIAWFEPYAGEWIVPATKYSVTTSHHQGTVSYAIRLTGEGERSE